MSEKINRPTGIGGIIKIPQRKIDEETSKRLIQEFNDAQFNPDYATGGRVGNVRIPFNLEEESENNTIQQ